MDSISSVATGAPISKPEPGAARNPPAPAAGSVPAGDPSRSEAATSEQLKAAVARANRQLDQSNRELTFVFDDKLGRMLVKIVDKQTNAVVRQVPSEDMLALARALSDSPARGVLIRSRA
jgi:flagellar protein FlaG